MHDHKAAAAKSYAPLPADLRSKLSKEVGENGAETTRKKYGLARDSFARALGGLTISRGTVAIIREEMSRKK